MPTKPAARIPPTARDPTQRTAAAIIEQAAQVSLFRVLIPYMIGQAFARVGDAKFMEAVAVKLGPGSEGQQLVMEGLAPADKVVVDGNLLLEKILASKD